VPHHARNKKCHKRGSQHAPKFVQPTAAGSHGRRRHRACAQDRSPASSHINPRDRPTTRFTLALEHLRRNGAAKLQAERAADLPTSLALLPIALSVSLPPSANADTIRLELISFMQTRIGDFCFHGNHSVDNNILTVKAYASAARGGVVRVDRLLQQREFSLPSPSTGADLPATATQCQPCGMLLPLGTTELVIHQVHFSIAFINSLTTLPQVYNGHREVVSSILGGGVEGL